MLYMTNADFRITVKLTSRLIHTPDAFKDLLARPYLLGVPG